MTSIRSLLPKDYRNIRAKLHFPCVANTDENYLLHLDGKMTLEDLKDTATTIHTKYHADQEIQLAIQDCVIVTEASDAQVPYFDIQVSHVLGKG